MFNILKINELLKQKRISKREFSKLIDKNENTIQNYLTGKTKIDVYTLEKIAKVLEVPVSYFFDETPSGNNIVTGNKVVQNGTTNKILISQSAEIRELKKEIQYLKEIIKQKDEIIKLLKK